MQDVLALALALSAAAWLVRRWLTRRRRPPGCDDCPGCAAAARRTPPAAAAPRARSTIIPVTDLIRRD